MSAETLSRIKVSLEQGSYIVFDIETTGGNPEKNGITEIFAIRYDGGEIKDTFYSLVNPCIPIPPIVRRMTGINNQMVRNAPRIEEVMPSFIKFIDRDVLVSHNTIGDMKFVRYFAQQACDVTLDNFYLCTHLLVEKLASEAPDKSLKGLAEFFELAKGELHRAEADAYVTLELFKVLLGRLAAHSVRRIDEAIRLQGDLESGMRLGWGVNPKALEGVPSGPGVFYLYDHERRLLFLSSALNLEREVGKLKGFGQLPRQLLRVVLRSYDLQAHRCPNIYAALLEECEALQSHRVTFSPVNWHQRNVQALYLADDPEGLLVGVGPMEEGTRHAFGPVRDRRLATELVEGIARAFDAKSGRRGLVLPRESEAMVLALLEGRLGEQLKQLDKHRRSVKLWFKPKERQEFTRLAKTMEALLSLRVPPRLASLLDRTGILIVPDQQIGTWQIYSLVGSRMRAVTTLRGDPEQKLRQAGFGRRLAEKIAREQAQVTAQPLTMHDVNRVNATLWWLYNAKGEGRFIPLAAMDFGDEPSGSRTEAPLDCDAEEPVSP